MLNGTLDVQTPIETAVRMKDHLNGPHQTFVTIPNANHGTIFASPTRPLGKAAGQPCGYLIIQSFLDNAQGEPDQSCLDELLPIDFPGVEANNVFFFGTPGIWTGVHTAPTGPDPRGPLERVIPRFPAPGPIGL